MYPRSTNHSQAQVAYLAFTASPTTQLQCLQTVHSQVAYLAPPMLTYSTIVVG